MRRIWGGTLLFALTWVMVGAVYTTSASAAPVQAAPSCFPGSNPAYPPTGNAVQIEASLRLVSGQFNVGSTGTLVVEGAQPGEEYCGTTFSTPIALPTTIASGAGVLRWTVPVPSSFELNAPHHVDLFRDQVQVASFDFCVNRSGAVTPLNTCGAPNRGANVPSASGDLPKTGTEVMDLVRIAFIVLAVGAGVLYLRRRGINRSRTA